jgi:hypothetical protein
LHDRTPVILARRTGRFGLARLERSFASLGPLDHLAVTVGDPLLNKPIMELTDEEARSAFEVQFWGQFNAVRAAYPHISRSGSITLVSGLERGHTSADDMAHQATWSAQSDSRQSRVARCRGDGRPFVPWLIHPRILDICWTEAGSLASKLLLFLASPTGFEPVLPP